MQNKNLYENALIDDLDYGNSLRYIVFDFETLTPKGRSPEPFELGYVILNSKFEILEENQVFVLPPKEVKFTDFDTKQTGVRLSDLSGAEDARTELAKFDKRLNNFKCIFIAQNATYDFNIFKRHSEVMSYSISRPFLDTIKLAKIILPNLERYGLNHLAQELGLKIPNDRHRALPDTLLTSEVFKCLLQNRNDSNIRSLSQLIHYCDISRWEVPKQMSFWD